MQTLTNKVLQVEALVNGYQNRKVFLKERLQTNLRFGFLTPAWQYLSDLESPDCGEGAGSVVTGAEVSLQPDQDVGVASVQTNPNLGGRQPEKCLEMTSSTYRGRHFNRKVRKNNMTQAYDTGSRD